MEDKNLDNPLDVLFTDTGSQVDPEALAMTLKPFMRIHRESRRVLFTAEGMKITAKDKIILFILAKKAMYMRQIEESDSVTPKEIKEELGQSIPYGTIDAALKRLSEGGLIKGQDGKYFVPDFSFPQIEAMFANIIQKLKKQNDHNPTSHKSGKE